MSPMYRKYHNHKVTVDGITFASKTEAAEYARLNADPDVLWFDMQPKFVVFPAFRKCCGTVYLKESKACPRCGKKPIPLIREITYTADFRVGYRDLHVEIIDVKGFENFRDDAFRLKQKLFERAFPELTLKLVYPPKKAKKVKA